MPGGLTQEIDNVSAISATTTNTLADTSDAAYSNASFWVEVEEVTGGSGWRVDVIRTFGSKDIVFAQTSTMSAAGAFSTYVNPNPVLSQDAKLAIPHPTKLSYVLVTGMGNLTATVHMTYGD